MAFVGTCFILFDEGATRVGGSIIARATIDMGCRSLAVYDVIFRSARHGLVDFAIAMLESGQWAMV